MADNHPDWEFAGTSRLNKRGATGTGGATIPKDVAEQFYPDDGGGVDMAVFTSGKRIMLVPSDEVSVSDIEP